jgi:predicted negative regulator of RcsB-dependent stress response
MASPALPKNSASPGNDPVPGAESPTPFEDRLKEIWDKNRSVIFAGCALILVAIVGKGVWDYVQVQREQGIERDYAQATTPAALRAFADLHPGHPLAGVALLTLADQAYAEGRMADAVAGYERADEALKSGPLAARAQLGEAISEVQSGQVADGEAALRALAADSKQISTIRAEATYHLATLAAAEGRADEVQSLATQLLQIDPSSPWVQRVFSMEASLPPPAPGAAAAGSPAISFQPKPAP